MEITLNLSLQEIMLGRIISWHEETNSNISQTGKFQILLWRKIWCFFNPFLQTFAFASAPFLTILEIQTEFSKGFPISSNSPPEM